MARGGDIVFHPNRIAVSNVEDRQSAIGEIDGLVKLVNRTWENRHEIEPSVEEQRRPTPMALFKLLPGTNCRQCGQPTCWNFALKLATAQIALALCPPLFEPAFAGRFVQLAAMVVPLTADTLA